MEGISPNLKLIMSLRQGLESGDSTRTAVRAYLAKNHDEASRELSIWLAQIENPQKSSPFHENKSINRREDLFQLIFRGLQGQSILPQLVLMEEESCESAKIEIEVFSAALPIKALFPLLLLQFPALLLLLFGPLLRQMLASF